jgi:hypothetical protein
VTGRFCGYGGEAIALGDFFAPYVLLAGQTTGKRFMSFGLDDSRDDDM